ERSHEGIPAVSPRFRHAELSRVREILAGRDGEMDLDTRAGEAGKVQRAGQGELARPRRERRGDRQSLRNRNDAAELERRACRRRDDGTPRDDGSPRRVDESVPQVEVDVAGARLRTED